MVNAEPAGVDVPGDHQRQHGWDGQTTPDAFDAINARGERTRARLSEVCEGLPLTVTGAGSLFKINASEHRIRSYRNSASVDHRWQELASLALANEGFLLSKGLQGCVGPRPRRARSTPSSTRSARSDAPEDAPLARRQGEDFARLGRARDAFAERFDDLNRPLDQRSVRGRKLAAREIEVVFQPDAVHGHRG